MSPENRLPMKDGLPRHRTYLVRHFHPDLKVKAGPWAQPFYPTVTLVFDSFSLMILGFAVGRGELEGASNALIYATGDKLSFCREYGIEPAQNLWPTAPLPNCIWLEPNCANSRWAKTVASELGVSIETTFGKLPMNRAISAASTMLFKHLCRKRVVEKREYLQMAIREIENENQRPKRSLKELRGHLGMDCQTPSAGQVWQWTFKILAAPPASLPSEKVRVALLGSTSGRLTRAGLEVNGLLYFPVPRGRIELIPIPTLSVPVKRDPSSIQHVYVKHNSGGFERWELGPRDILDSDLSWSEWDALREARRKAMALAKRNAMTLDLLVRAS